MPTRRLWNVPAAWSQASWSPDGRTLALQHAEKITIYDVASGVPSHSLPATFCCNSAATSQVSAWLSDSRGLLLCTQETSHVENFAVCKTLCRYDLEQPTSFLEPLPWSRSLAEAAPEVCSALTLSPNDQQFAALKHRPGATSAALCIAATDSEDAALPYVLSLLRPHDKPAQMAWSPNSQYLAVAWDRQLLIVHPPTQRYNYLPQTRKNLYRGTPKCAHLKIAFSPSNQHVALSTPYRLQIYDVHAQLQLERQALNELEFPCACQQQVLQWSTDGTRLLWAQNQKIVLLAEAPLQLTAKQKLLPYLTPAIHLFESIELLFFSNQRRHNSAADLSPRVLFGVSLGLDTMLLGSAWLAVTTALKTLLPSTSFYGTGIALLGCYLGALVLHQDTCDRLFYLEKTPLKPSRRMLHRTAGGAR